MRKKIDIPFAPGVYLATTPSGRMYIGRSVNMRQRVLSHLSMLQNGNHYNEQMQRSFDKYKGKIKWSVLMQTDDEASAVHYEQQFIEMWWNTGKLINARKGDQLDALYNERHKRQERYVMNVWSGGVIKLNYVSEYPCKMLQEGSRSRAIPKSVYGISIEECKQKRMDYLRNDMTKNASTYANKATRRIRKNVGYHIRNIHTGYVGYAKDVGELKKLNAVDSLYSKTNSFQNGWQVRRIRCDWSWLVPSIHCIAVFGLHVTGKVKRWKSITECQRDLGDGAQAAIRGHKRTYKGWRLTT
jgi:predicted GIY-YIG superfamily endonuclease